MEVNEMKITRKNIVSKVSEKQNGMYSLKELDSIISDCLESIGEYLEEGETVDLTGFGKFEITERSEHQGINPATKEKIMIPATKNVKFRPSKSLKERVKK